MTSDWKKFVQINIYDRTLLELREEGVALEAILNGIGCSKFWIGEGSVPAGEYKTVTSGTVNVPELVLSTTLANFPRFSTPLTSRQFTMNFTTNISRIDSNSCEFVNSNSTIDYSTDHSVNSVEENELIVKKVVQELVDRVDLNFRMQKFETNTIQRSLSAYSKTQKALKTFKSLHIVSDVNTHKRDFESEAFKNQGSGATDQCAREMCSMTSTDYDQPISYSYDTSSRVFGGENESESNYDETLEIDTFTPPPPYVQPTGSILKKNVFIQKRREFSKKMVSFKSPIKVNRINTDDGEVHTSSKGIHELFDVKCHFSGCKTTYKWRPRYGKVRLMDHVFTHMTELKFNCSHCTFTTASVRSIRYHYKKRHSSDMTVFGMKSLLNSRSDYIDFLKAWNDCFRKNNINGLELVEKRMKWLSPTKEPSNDADKLPKEWNRII